MWETDCNSLGKLKRVQKLGQYSVVHKFACIFLKIQPNQLPKGALYRKLMQYGINLSTKHPSETNKKKIENSNLKSIMFLVKNKTFYNIPINIKILCNENNIILKYFADIRFDIRFGMYFVQFNRQNRIFLEMKFLQCIQNDVVVNFNDVIRSAHCALNIELTQPVAILTFQWIL